MIDLVARIESSLCGRIMIASMPDLLIAALENWPEDMPICDPYTLAIVRTDIIEEIANQMRITY